MKRNGNLAALVTITTPRAAGVLWGWYRLEKPMTSCFCRSEHQKPLAIRLRFGVVLFTYELSWLFSPTLLPQTPSASPQWDSQRPSRPSQRPPVSRNQLLRPPGSATGQVRDAAPSAAGGPADQPGGGPFRVFAPGLLQSPAGFSARRLNRAPAQTARPQGRLQTHAGDPGLCRANPPLAPGDPHAGVGAADSRAVCRAGASTQPGASLSDSEKKQSTS